MNNENNMLFGIIYPSHIFCLGTREYVHDFFRIINELIDNKTITDSFRTISFDLYRTFVGSDGLGRFKVEWPLLQKSLSAISASAIDWGKYPSYKFGNQFNSKENMLDLNQSSMADVFHKYFCAMSDACEWMDIEVMREDNKYTPRILVCPTDNRISRRFFLISDEELLAAADDPLWLREPG